MQAATFRTIVFTQAQTAGLAATYNPDATVATAGLVQIGNSLDPSVLTLAAPLLSSSSGLTFSSFAGASNTLQLGTFGISAPNGGTLSLGVASGAVDVETMGGVISGSPIATLALAACNVTDTVFAGFGGAIGTVTLLFELFDVLIADCLCAHSWPVL